MKPLLHQNILIYVIYIFNPPTNEHEAPSTPEILCYVINIFNPPTKDHEAPSIPEYPKLCY
jgi:hypothetical protein